MKNTFEDLIEKRLDGTISEQESDLLDRTCRDDEHARNALDAAVLTDEMVAVLAEAQPPSELRARIMDSLPDQAPWHVQAAPGRARSTGRHRAVRRSWIPAVFGVGGLSLGAVLAVLIMLIWTGAPQNSIPAWDGSQVAGTMSTVDGEPVWSLDGELAAGGTFLVQVWTDESSIRIHAAGSSPEGARLVISYPSGTLKLNSVIDEAPSSARMPSYSAESGRFQSSVNGPFDVWVTMHREPGTGSLDLRIMDGARSVVDEELNF